MRYIIDTQATRLNMDEQSMIRYAAIQGLICTNGLIAVRSLRERGRNVFVIDDTDRSQWQKMYWK